MPQLLVFTRWCAACAPFLLALLVSGCANQPTQPTQPAQPAAVYVPPSSGPVATVLLRVNHLGGRYTVSTYEQAATCSQRRQLLSGSVPQPERQQRVLAANRLQTLSFMHVRDDRQSCQVIRSFEPRAGKTYLMRSTASKDGCTLEIIDATNPEQPSQEATGIARERTGLGLNDNACKPLVSSVPGTAAPKALNLPGAAGQGTPSLEPFRDLLPKN